MAKNISVQFSSLGKEIKFWWISRKSYQTFLTKLKIDIKIHIESKKTFNEYKFTQENKKIKITIKCQIK